MQRILLVLFSKVRKHSELLLQKDLDQLEKLSETAGLHYLEVRVRYCQKTYQGLGKGL